MSDHDSTIPQPEQHDSEPNPLTRLASLRGRPLLCFVGEFTIREVQAVRDLMPQLSSHEGFSGKLSVLLESPGGLPDDVFRIALALREYAHDLEILVPQWAKSAATLFCLAADTIHIGMHGELGPLDPQKQNLRGSFRGTTAALESFGALQQLLVYSLESLDGIVRHLLVESFRREAPMDIPYAIEHASPLFGAIVSPLFSQVDPHELGDAGRALQISERYAERIMKRWGYANIGDEDRQEIARRLTWDYPSHGYVIDLDEARDIGLNIHRMDPESDFLSHGIIKAVESGETASFINLFFPDPNTQTDDNDSNESQETDNDTTHPPDEPDEADGTNH